MNDKPGILQFLRVGWLWPYGATILVLGLAVLIAGVLLKSTVLLWAGIASIVGLIGAAWFTWSRDAEEDRPSIDAEPENLDRGFHQTHSPGTMVFDDFRVGHEIPFREQERSEADVIPSAKTTRPAPRESGMDPVRELDIPDFFDLEAETPYTDVEPRSEFHLLLDKALLVVKDVMFAHTVAFFWTNREKQEMVLESMAAGSSSFMKGRRLSIGTDLVSQVGTTGKPRIVDVVDPASELDLLPYYDAPVGVKSVVGVPVFFVNGGKDVSPVGMMVVDSLAEDQFGQETLSVLGRFTKLVSALIKSYTDKYDLLLDAELLASIRRMHDRTGSSPSEGDVLETLLDEVHRLATWESLALVMFDEGKNGWTVQRAQNKGTEPWVTVDSVIAADASVVGEVIHSNGIRVVDDLSLGHKPLFQHSEPSTSAGSFLGVPISSFNRCYGALALASPKPGNFQKSETEAMFRLVQNAAAILEVVYMNDVVREHVPVDRTTGGLTKKHFERRLSEEVQRAADLGTELSLVSIALDHAVDQSQRYGAEAIEAILGTVAGVVRSTLRGYDILGRESDSRLNVLLVNTTASDAYLWAEKVRKQIAGHVVVAGQKSFSTTVSIGICGLLDGMLVDDLTAGTNHVLTKAMEHGGNLVRVH
jgi:diguanylate cyclase (GGDEF)-like protein